MHAFIVMLIYQYVTLQCTYKHIVMTTYNQILPDVGSVKSRQVSTAFLLGFTMSALWGKRLRS